MYVAFTVPTMTVAILFLKIFAQTPPTLRLSLIGLDKSGKTVYTTVLFNELLINNNEYENVRFSMYGTDTTERVLDDYALLNSGTWPESTPYSGMFTYHAKLSLHRNKNYKLEITDFAGEKYKHELVEYFHKAGFYNHVKKSDIVFFVIDLARTINKNEYKTINDEYVTDIEKKIIAMLNLLQNEENESFNNPIGIPIVLLFMKSDLLNKYKIDENLIIEKFNRLIKYFSKNCECYEHFLYHQLVLMI